MESNIIESHILYTLVILTKILNEDKILEVLVKIHKQNKIMISLLGRLALPEEKLKTILVKNAKKPQQMVKAYNFCDGTLTTNEIAKKLTGITSRALNIATERWEDNGIIINLGERGRGRNVIPLHLYKIGDGENSE